MSFPRDSLPILFDTIYKLQSIIPVNINIDIETKMVKSHPHVRFMPRGKKIEVFIEIQIDANHVFSLGRGPSNIVLKEGDKFIKYQRDIKRDVDTTGLDPPKYLNNSSNIEGFSQRCIDLQIL